MTDASSLVISAAAAFGLDAAILRPLAGNSGSAWDAGERVLRVGPGPRMEAEMMAVALAAGVLPVPRVIDRVEVGDTTAVLLEKLPGEDAATVASRTPTLARAIGRACGVVHAQLAAVPAPPELPPAAQGGGGTGARLLHLDLHPYNILVSPGAEVTGVIDWANTAAGDPALDRARSWSIMNLDPAARARRAEPLWRALTEGWAETGTFPTIPATARAWACRFMLTDLARRYSSRDLAHVRDALGQAEAACR
jgi:aminoglycoside phosphotransferase (APT) family kinase protein